MEGVRVPAGSEMAAWVGQRGDVGKGKLCHTPRGTF